MKDLTPDPTPPSRVRLSDYQTLRTIARNHRIPYSTLYVRVKVREIPVLRIGNMLLIRNSAIHRACSEGQVGRPSKSM